MFDFWYELPKPLRVVFALVLIGIGVLIWLGTGGRVYAIGLVAIGFVFLLAAGAGGDKGGYNF
jgi:hypothetical protein